MFNFIRFIFKRPDSRIKFTKGQGKKFVSFMLLFFVISGIVIPHRVLAEVEWWHFLVAPGLVVGSEIIGSEVGSEVKKFVSDTFKDLYIAILSGLANLIMFVFYEVANFSVRISSYALRIIENLSITRNPVFLNGWGMVRNWANMLILLGLMGIAVATILRFQEYGARKLLTPLLIVALLVNFSTVFVGSMIDTSNLVMEAFLGKISDAGGALIAKVNSVWNDTLRIMPVSSETVEEWAGLTVFFAIIYLLIGISFLYLAIIMFERYIILALLFILSPLAFVFFVFPIPKAKELSSLWWRHFIKWCFIGVSSSFFLWLSVGVMEFLKFNNVKGLEIFFQLFVILGFLVIGLKLTKKAAGPVAGAVMGIAKKVALGTAMVAGGVALAGAGKTLKGVGQASGVSGVAQRMGRSIGDSARDRATKVKEFFGLVPRGTLQQNQANREAERMKEYDKLAAGRPTEDLLRDAKGSAITDEGRRKRAAATRKLVESGNAKLLGESTEERAEKIKSAQGYYGPPDSEASRAMWAKAKTKDADLATHDDYAMNELRLKHPRQTDKSKKDYEDKTSYDSKINSMALGDAYAKMDDSEFKKMSNSDIIAKAKQDTAEGKQALEEAINRDILYMVGSFDETAKLIQEGDNKYGSNAMFNARKLDPKYAEYDTKAIHNRILRRSPTTDLAKITPTSPEYIVAQQEERLDAYGRVNAGSLRKEISQDAFNMELVESIDADTITRAHQQQEGLSRNKIHKLKGLLSQIQTKISTLEANALIHKKAGELAEADELYNQAIKLEDTYKAIELLK